MSQEIQILLGTEDEYHEFWRSVQCCWGCFTEEMGSRGYDITVVNEWLEEGE